MASTSERERLRRLGQADLGAWIEVATGNELWSIQEKIATAVSRERARVCVPSCNASGKTFLAARIALAFFDSFTPGTPCDYCGGPCRGAKVLTTSSKETHLKDNLWGEIRLAVSQLAQRGIEIQGNLPPAEPFLHDGPDHFLRGQVATKEESMQGYHAAHKLIVGDEATSVNQDVARGITSLMATADTRLLLIFNPTTPETYAAQMTRSHRTETIRIRAFDTPHFTGEHVPEGSNLTTPSFLEDLKAQGMGEGSYEWTTRVLAEFYDLGDDLLISVPWVERAKEADLDFSHVTQLGVDFATYGTNESTIGVRRGDTLVDMRAFPAGRLDHFVNGDGIHQGALRQAVEIYRPHAICYDADGVGAGAIGEMTRLHEWAKKEGHMTWDSQIIGFRAAKKVSDTYQNARSGWWWALRKRFENGRIAIKARDPKMEAQLTQIKYDVTATGAIRVESKDKMRQRDLDSPDRADAAMYAFAYSEELPEPLAPTNDWVVTAGFVDAHPDTPRWYKDLVESRSSRSLEINPVTGIPDELD